MSYRNRVILNTMYRTGRAKVIANVVLPIVLQGPGSGNPHDSIPKSRAGCIPLVRGPALGPNIAACSFLGCWMLYSKVSKRSEGVSVQGMTNLVSNQTIGIM